jgi:hypothetical protein
LLTSEPERVAAVLRAGTARLGFDAGTARLGIWVDEGLMGFLSFHNPWALLLGALAVPVVLLYRRRTRMPRATLAAGAIWREVLAEEGLRARWAPWRERVSLAVQLLAVGLLVLAAADPRLAAPPHDEPPVDWEAISARRADSAVAVEFPGSPPLGAETAALVRQFLDEHPPRAETRPQPLPLGEAPPSRPRRGAPLGPWLVAVAVVLLAGEWCLYQRRWFS